MQLDCDYNELPTPRSREDDPWPLFHVDTDPSASGEVFSNWPKISIVTPSFNQSKWLEKTIRSVLLQGYPNLEYIIIDGGSSDDSIDLIQKYEPWITYWVSEADRGQSHAINKGFEKATGEVFAWLNSDDIYSPNALETLAKAWHHKQPKTGAIVGDGQILETTGAVWYQPPMHEIDNASIFDWLNHKNFMQPSCFFSSAAWKDCGPLDEAVHIALDVDLWLNISKTYEFQRIEALLSYSLKHDGAKTTRDEQKMYVDLAFVFLKHGNYAAARAVLESQAQQFLNREKELKELQNRLVNRVDQKVRSFWQRHSKRLKVFGNSNR